MAARSAIATFNNETNVTLTLNSAVLQHGEWDTQPPQTIGPLSSATWSSESDGFATGTQGQVVYSLPGGVVTTTYDNPFSGTNGCTADAPPAYQVNCTTTDGDNQVVTYTLTGGS
jgi:hypothetical protein